MISQWEEFQYGPNNRNEDLRVTLSKKGEITVGMTAFEKMGRPERAVLLFDRVNSRIGVCPTKSEAKNAHPLIQRKGMRYRVVRANRFCRHFGIKVQRTVTFDEPTIDEKGILVPDLSAMTNV